MLALYTPQLSISSILSTQTTQENAWLADLTAKAAPQTLLATFLSASPATQARVSKEPLGLEPANGTPSISARVMFKPHLTENAHLARMGLVSTMAFAMSVLRTASLAPLRGLTITRSMLLVMNVRRDMQLLMCCMTEISRSFREFAMRCFLREETSSALFLMRRERRLALSAQRMNSTVLRTRTVRGVL